MPTSLRALLAGVIDYAGLFPPARLPLDQAIANYARYRTDPDSWMLGRFVCPAAQLAELASVGDELFSSGPPFAFAALGRGVSTVGELLDNLRDDLEAIASFRERHGERVVVDVLEARLPADVLGPRKGDEVRALLDAAADLVESRGPPVLTPFYEATVGLGWRASVLGVIVALAGHNHAGMRGWKRCRPAGYKLRCGGLEAAAFPSPEEVAGILTACRSAGVALKATAGLHHPVRHLDAALQTRMHGFLNIFGAGVLAYARDLGEEQVRAILEDEDVRNFGFDAGEIRWKDVCATREEVATARRHAVLSFGSCSFDEPCADLRALGLLA